jgi:DNA-binding transcriptional ArsR family regulator
MTLIPSVDTRSSAVFDRQGAHSDEFLDTASVTALAETFRALGDVTRVRILDALSKAERCVQDIAKGLDLSESAVSHQLRLLRGMRLVRVRRSGRQMFYALDDHHVVRLFAQGLEHVQERDRPNVTRARSMGESIEPVMSESIEPLMGESIEPSKQ